MSEEPKPRSVWPVVTAAALPVLYFLSAGPMVWLEARGWHEGELHRFFFAFYAPLRWLYEHTEGARRLIDRYVNLWS